MQISCTFQSKVTAFFQKHTTFSQKGLCQNDCSDAPLSCVNLDVIIMSL